jgi:hypothetical protein
MKQSVRDTLILKKSSEHTRRLAKALVCAAISAWHISHHWGTEATGVPHWCAENVISRSGSGRMGLMAGVAMTTYGMSTVEVVLMAVVFAGSSQLAALPLIASGAPTGGAGDVVLRQPPLCRLQRPFATVYDASGFPAPRGQLLFYGRHELRADDTALSSTGARHGRQGGAGGLHPRWRRAGLVQLGLSQPGQHRSDQCHSGDLGARFRRHPRFAWHSPAR